MQPIASSSRINRRVVLSTLALLPALSGPLLPVSALAQTATPGGGLLPSWNDGPAKQAILDFVRGTTDRSSPSYVSLEDRIAVFDQDGTLWVEHPMYTQVVYCLERVPAVVAKKPELKNVEPVKTVLSGNREAMAKLSLRDLEMILAATLRACRRRSSTPKRRSGLKPRAIHVGSGRIPNSSISRCSKCCATCATRP